MCPPLSLTRQSALDALADLEKQGLALSPRSIAGLRRRIEAINHLWPLSLLSQPALAAEDNLNPQCAQEGLCPAQAPSESGGL
jgi:hypothetical protein